VLQRGVFPPVQNSLPQFLFLLSLSKSFCNHVYDKSLEMAAGSLNVLTLAKVAGIVSSGLFTGRRALKLVYNDWSHNTSGFCWSHSFSTASTNLLANDEHTMIRQWTLYYMQGSFVSLDRLMTTQRSCTVFVANLDPTGQVAIPCTLINISSWAFLAYSGKSKDVTWARLSRC
jgi:hypothetical protein